MALSFQHFYGGFCGSLHLSLALRSAHQLGIEHHARKQRFPYQQFPHQQFLSAPQSQISDLL